MLGKNADDRKSKYYAADMVHHSEGVNHVPMAGNSTSLEFQSLASEERETYYSEESVSKNTDIYKSLQDDFVSIDRSSTPTNPEFSTPRQSRHISIDKHVVSTESSFDKENTVVDDFGKEAILSSLGLPTIQQDFSVQSALSSADEISRLDSVLKKWQAAVDKDEDDDNERIVSPSLFISLDGVEPGTIRLSPISTIEDTEYQTFTPITFQEAGDACLSVSIQPCHYSSSAVLRHTTKSACSCCCISPPANDSKSATDRALVFAIADWRYSESQPVHWRTMASIYSVLTGEPTNVYRYGPHWDKIGFQGGDPVTDLRSAGFLGLLHLLFLTTEAKKLAQNCYKLSIQPRSQFPLAITGLNLTRMVMNAIRSGRLRVKRHSQSKVSAVSNGGVTPASDRFLLASCKLYVALWHNFISIWSARHCTIENSHEVLTKLERMVSKNSNQLLKKSIAYLNSHSESSPKRPKKTPSIPLSPSPRSLNATNTEVSAL